jgi:L-lactate dehydrogenase complex protein LldF
VNHAQHADRFVADRPRARWHDESLWFVRSKRDGAAAALPEWEQLRDLAARIKAHTGAQLADYLEGFERAATARGAIVHWAADAESHNRIVGQILGERDVRRVVKSKSMLTEECGLNPYLEALGIEVVDSDLGERIVQLREEPPSHIVLPAIHLRREEVGELFHRELGTEAGLSDPTRLTEAARRHLREKFLGAEAGITGVNFGIAETGGVVICTNEGNADLGTALPPLHIASMGIEKLIPRTADLPIFLRLLARSATGQPITAYTSHMHGPRPGGELHIVIVDNGRSQILSQPAYRQALACIRCGACLNTCPVYRRSGGYSYESVVPGPIGSTLGPALDPGGKSSLPYACTLCGSCADVCPVKIDLDRQLYRWRRDLVAAGHIARKKKLAAALASQVLRRPRLYRLAGRVGRLAAGRWPRLAAALVPAWTASRDLPEMPERSFREQLEDGDDE